MIALFGYTNSVKGHEKDGIVFAHTDVKPTGEVRSAGKNYPPNPVYKCLACGREFQSTINNHVEDTDIDSYRKLTERFIIPCKKMYKNLTTAK